MREVLEEHRPDVVFHAAAYKHVRDDGGQPRRGDPQQRARDAGRRRGSPARPACGTFVLVSTDKAVKPATVMGASKALAEWAVEAAATRYPRHRVRDRAVRERARLLRLGRADLPPPDRRRRSGDGHRPADDALLHDDPGGRAADHPRRLAERGERRGVRARDGRAGRDHRSCRDDDPALRARARAGHRDRDRRRAARARSSTRTCSTPTSARSRRRPRRSCAPPRERLDPQWVEQIFGEINLLVLEGDAAALAQHVAKLSSSRFSSREAREAREADTRLPRLPT